MENSVIDEKYRIIKKIGSGGFGEIYLGESIENGLKVAIKTEKANVRRPKIFNEASVYRVLEGGVGIPRVMYQGTDKEYNFLVMDLLGESLQDLFNFCNNKFSMKTVLMLADQMVAHLEFMHSKGLIHRDIKPGNFLIGIGRQVNKLFMIDFGLANKYKDLKTDTHIPLRDCKRLIGSLLFASNNAQLGKEQSRRDDMEALGYLMVYLLRGTLPWREIKYDSIKQLVEKVCETKISTPIESLCQWLPIEFHLYFKYCRCLDFEETPDYEFLRELFQVLFRNLNYQFDYKYDWTPETVLDQNTHEEREGEETSRPMSSATVKKEDNNNNLGG